MAKIPAKLKTLAQEALAGKDVRLIRAVRQVVENYLGERASEKNDKEDLQRLLDEDRD